VTRLDWIAAAVVVGTLVAGFVLFVVFLGSPTGVR
jgi:hypothetical protein